MTTGFAEFQEHDRRLVLLRALAAAAQYRANAYLLRRYCDAVGHVVGADRIEADLAWLRDSGLVGLQREGDVTVATLTARGLDVSAGRTQVPGVARPQPGG
jgi:hypothetical protein